LTSAPHCTPSNRTVPFFQRVRKDGRITASTDWIVSPPSTIMVIPVTQLASPNPGAATTADYRHLAL